MNTTFGRYRLLERIGQGGMAEVFKAKSCGVEGFEKIVVIKRILPELATSQEFVDMFIHEAKLAVRLSHANVVQVFDLGIAPAAEEPGDPADASAAYYMAMEYVAGLDLATLLSMCRRQNVPIPIEMAIYVAAEVAKGLDHAHRRRDEQNEPLHVVHLDVSPQNVLLSLEGEVKVTDFGIAKAQGLLESRITEDTQARRLKGKYGYMSPEHAAGKSVDARSDLFSLGTVLYEMIAGVNPFSAPTPFETLRRVTASEYPPVSLLRPDVPQELVSLLQTAMAADVDDRFADAGRMYEALLTLLYTQGKRFSAHHLAEFLAAVRSDDDAGPKVVLDADASLLDKTPVEASRRSSPVSENVPVAEDVSHGIDVERTAVLGERREVTALVVELPFHRSALSSEQEDEAEIVEDGLLTERIAAVVTRHGGRVVAQNPEQLTTLFGLDEPDGLDTETAARCALVVLRSSTAWRRPSAGIATGRIHVSSDGVPTPDERLSVLIARARDLARVREGACAVSVEAMRIVRHRFEFDSLDESRSDGISRSNTLVLRDVKRPREAFGRFVGRRAELRHVGEIIGAVMRRRARVLTIRGEHGIGKTRLLVEIERRLRKGNYNMGWHTATCPPRGVDAPLSGIQCMMHVLCGVPEGDPNPPVARMVPRLRALGLAGDEVKSVLLALGVHVDPPSNVRGSLLHAFMKMIHRLCEDRSHAFVWDAAHGMDAESFSFVQTVLDRLPSSRALFVFATRTGFSHALEASDARAHTSSIELEALDEEDAERLALLRLDVTRLPTEVAAFVHERAKGHPQMIEELVTALIEARAVTVADGSVVAMRLVDEELLLPKTLRGLLASRMLRLTNVERGILQAASVLSEPIDVDVLARMTSLETNAIERVVSTLVARAFLVYVGPLELRLASPVVREAVTFALTKEALCELHAAAGHALERDERASSYARRIADHFYASGDGARAGVWFATSADLSLEAGRFHAASLEYARAIELCDPDYGLPDRIANWFSGLAKATTFVRSLPEALETCEHVISRIDVATTKDASSLDDRTSRELRVRVRVDAGRILGALDLVDAARAQFTAAEAIAAEDVDLVKGALMAAAEFAVRQGDVRRSSSLLERLSAMPETGDPRERYRLAMSLAQTRAAMGDDPAALRHFEHARALLSDDPSMVPEGHKLRAFIAYAAKDYRLAAHHFDQAAFSARELGLNFDVAVNLHNLADALIHAGDPPHAYGALQQSVALSDELGQERLSSHNRMFLAYLDGLAGDESADKVLDTGIAYAEANDFTWEVLGGLLLRAKLLAARGATNQARAQYQRLRDFAEAKGHRVIVDDCEAALRAT